MNELKTIIETVKNQTAERENGCLSMRSERQLVAEIERLSRSNIVTHYEYPPIPIRTFDWMAYSEGDEEGGPRGWGRTEQEAIADLVENYDE